MQQLCAGEMHFRPSLDVQEEILLSIQDFLPLDETISHFVKQFFPQMYEQIQQLPPKDLSKRRFVQVVPGTFSEHPERVILEVLRARSAHQNGEAKRTEIAHRLSVELESFTSSEKTPPALITLHSVLSNSPSTFKAKKSSTSLGVDPSVMVHHSEYRHIDSSSLPNLKPSPLAQGNLSCRSVSGVDLDDIPLLLLGDNVLVQGQADICSPVAKTSLASVLSKIESEFVRRNMATVWDLGCQIHQRLTRGERFEKDEDQRRFREIFEGSSIGSSTTSSASPKGAASAVAVLH